MSTIVITDDFINPLKVVPEIEDARDWWNKKPYFDPDDELDSRDRVFVSGGVYYGGVIVTNLEIKGNPL